MSTETKNEKFETNWGDDGGWRSFMAARREIPKMRQAHKASKPASARRSMRAQRSQERRHVRFFKKHSTVERTPLHTADRSTLAMAFATGKEPGEPVQR